MRTIKFRGQRIDNGEWVYGFLYLLPLPTGVVCMILTTDNTHEDNSIEPEYHLAFTLWVDLFPVKPETVGQYISLIDKKGKDIYEGDIYWRDPAKGWSSWPYCVDYCNGAWIGKDSDGGWLALIEEDSELLSNQLDYIEVVGNIHDNPELLNAER